MPPRNRTTIDVNESYGKLSTPVIPPTTPPTPASVVITSIFHADAERDEYFSPRLYALGDASFDHNYGQGLQFQQVYGGGIGYTAIKDAKQELDLKADVHYEKQPYISTTVNGVVTTTPSVNIIGTTFFEGYHRNLPRKMLFTESAELLPAWNDFKAYSANFTAALALPVFKRLSATVSVADNFLNDPAALLQKELLPVHHRRHLRAPVTRLCASFWAVRTGPGCSNGEMRALWPASVCSGVRIRCVMCGNWQYVWFSRVWQSVCLPESLPPQMPRL